MEKLKKGYPSAMLRDSPFQYSTLKEKTAVSTQAEQTIISLLTDCLCELRRLNAAAPASPAPAKRISKQAQAKQAAYDTLTATLPSIIPYLKSLHQC